MKGFIYYILIKEFSLKIAVRKMSRYCLTLASSVSYFFFQAIPRAFISLFIGLVSRSNTECSDTKISLKPIYIQDVPGIIDQNRIGRRTWARLFSNYDIFS